MPEHDYEHNTKKPSDTTKPINFNFSINIPPPNLTIPKSIIGTNTDNHFSQNANPLNLNFNINTPPPNLTIPKDIIGTNTDNHFSQNENPPQPKDYTRLIMGTSNNPNALSVPNIGHIGPPGGDNEQLIQNILELKGINNIRENEPDKSISEESEELSFVPEKLPPPKRPRIHKYTQTKNLQISHFISFAKIPKNRPYLPLISGFKHHLQAQDKQLKQPTREDVINYLGQYAFMFIKLNQDRNEVNNKIPEWLQQMQRFFAWASKKRLYENIAADISSQDIHNKATEYTVQQEKNDAIAAEVKKQKSQEMAAQKKEKQAKKLALAEGDEQAKRKALRSKRDREHNKREAAAAAAAVEAALKEPEPPAKKIDPKAIDAKWIEMFIKSKKPQGNDVKYSNLEKSMNTFHEYIQEHDINRLTKVDILKFLVTHKETKTFLSIKTNLIALKNFFSWLSSPPNQFLKLETSDIDDLVPTYIEMRRFERQTTIKGNNQLKTASFKNEWFEQFTKDMKKIESKSMKKLSNQPRHIKALCDYINKDAETLKINPSHILDFFVIKKADIAEKNINNYLSTYRRLFKWTAIKENKDGSMYYPDIIGSHLRQQILGQLIPILRHEYEKQALIGQAPKHPTSEYFKNFMQTIKNPDDGVTAITFENFIKYLQKLFNIQIDNESASSDSDIE